MIKVGIDIDDVLVPMHESILGYADQRLGIHRSLEDCLDYSLPVTLGISQESFDVFADEFVKDGFLLKLDVFPEALRVLERYSGFIEPYFITARGSDLFEHTDIWLQSTGIVYDRDNLYLTEDKASLAVRLGIDLFIEDSGEMAVSIAKKNIPVLLVRYPWNEYLFDEGCLDCVDYGGYIVPVEGWGDIGLYLDGLYRLSV